MQALHSLIKMYTNNLLTHNGSTYFTESTGSRRIHPQFFEAFCIILRQNVTRAVMLLWQGTLRRLSADCVKYDISV